MPTQGLLTITREAKFWLASYTIWLPDRLLTVKVVLATVLAKVPLRRVQLPVEAVTQLTALPGMKLAFTVALATAAPVLTLRTLATTEATQPPLALAAEPLSARTATT